MKNLENIVERTDEEYKRRCTFVPTVNINPQRSKKRQLDEFVGDHMKYVQKVGEKLDKIKQKRDEKEVAEVLKKPVIDKKSKRLFDQLHKDIGEPTHLRLYYIKEAKKDTEEKKVEIVDQVEEKYIQGKKVKVTKRVKKVVTIKKDDAKDKEKKDKLKSEEYIFGLYAEHGKKKERMEKLTKKIEEEQSYFEVKGALEMSNKVMLRRFLKQYHDSLNMVITSENPNKLNLIQLNTLFEILKIISPPDSKDITNLTSNASNVQNTKNSEVKEENTLKDIPVLNESIIRQKEKKLVCGIWESLKNDEGLVSADHIFLFLLAVLNIYEYYLYDSYKRDMKKDEKKQIKPEESKDPLAIGEPENLNNTEPNNPVATIIQKAISVKTLKAKKKGDKVEEKTIKEIEKEQIMVKIQEDTNSKVKITKKYCSFDENNKFLLSFANSRLINRDFNLFYVNWSTNTYTTLKNEFYDIAEKNNIPGTYKPKINDKSAKLFLEFRKKLQNDTHGNTIKLPLTNRLSSSKTQ